MNPAARSPQLNFSASKISSLSVTKVRLAFECPRLMYLGHHEGGMTMFRASNSSGGGIGKAFHTLCDDCVAHMCSDGAIATLLSPPTKQLNPETIAQQIQQHLYRAVFFPLVQNTIKNTPNKVPALNQLWEGITGLIRRWAELLVSNRSLCEPQDVIRKTFLAQELSVKHEFELPNGDRQLVRGRFDSLVYDFVQQRLCVVEYKTYQAIDPAAQLAQVALYSYMLQQKLKVNINSAVYSVLPDWNGVEYPWDLLEDTLHQLIPHKLMQMRDWLSWRSPNPSPPPMTAHLELCNICPQKNKCQTYFETDAIAAPSEPQVPDLVLSDNIPPLVTGTVAESFALDYSKPIKVETLQVESLQVETVRVESIPPHKSSPRKPDPKSLTSKPLPAKPSL